MTKRSLVETLARGVEHRRGQRCDRDDPRNGQRLAGAASLVIVGAVLWPVIENWRKLPRDGFPLSYYPMFSAKRSARVRVTHLVGVDAAGQRYPLSYLYAGSGGLNQVRRQIYRIVKQGQAADLCLRVALRVERRPMGLPAEIVTVQVVTGEYRLADYFRGKKAPLSEIIHASAPCGRPMSTVQASWQAS